MIFLLLLLIVVDTVTSECDPEVHFFFTFQLNDAFHLQGGGDVQHHADDQLDTGAVPQAVPHLEAPSPVVTDVGLLSLPASHPLRDRKRGQ